MSEEKPTLRIVARYLGPVFALDHSLSNHKQNLVFARNGTGKSFLSRALRYLDQYGQSKSIEDAPKNLVSDESSDGKGEFVISLGHTELGSLKLNKLTGASSASLSDSIFHVFSEDFVHEELRQRDYTLNGEIDNTIAVGSDLIKTKDAEDALQKALLEEAEAAEILKEAFRNAKDSELVGKAGINRGLREFKALDLEDHLAAEVTKPETPKPTFSEIIQNLDQLKSLPNEPEFPDLQSTIQTDDLDLVGLSALLTKVTSPSTVSDEIKARIDAHREFYANGVKILGEMGSDKCPFCEQSILLDDPKAIIDRYVQYFEAEEQKHKAELRRHLKALDSKETELHQLSPRFSFQQTKYNKLKRFLPSKKDTELALGEVEIEAACEAISIWRGALEEKTKALSEAISTPEMDIKKCLGRVNSVIEKNNLFINDIEASVRRSDNERKELQRSACKGFSEEFLRENWADIEKLRNLRNTVRERRAELDDLTRSAPKTGGRERVADTFELLLRVFFGERYLFDKDKFVLRRGDHEMVRGPSRTLSDGEKTAIAFCYFLASVHTKVSSISDYQKIFLIFDDPVTSMSYDYIFTIAQTLKNLCISGDGDVSVNPSKISDGQYLRPRLLVLTHSSYFFNISFSNKVVKDSASFALFRNGNAHNLERFSKYVAPFQDQLRDIYEVAEGKDPDHTTGNAIRSVLEAVGRFCRPDKPNVTDFITFIAGEEGIELKSTLINSFSHGTYYEEVPPPDDIRQACKDTLAVVNRYAFGQIELVRKSVMTPSKSAA